MTDNETDDRAPAYYPPRASWPGRLRFRARRTLRRALRPHNFGPSASLSFRQVLLCLILPGFSFFLLGRRLLAGLFCTAYAAAGVLFLVQLGFLAGSIAYGLAISVHALSIAFLEGWWLRQYTFRARLGLALLTLVAVWALVYSPLTRLAQQHWVLPVRRGERVLIVQRHVAPNSLHRGDWVAYQMGERQPSSLPEGVRLQAGLGMDPVVALPGDRVRFSPQTVFVNEQPYPAAPHMPGQGEFVVPEKVWFIWPTLAINRPGGFSEENVSAAMQQIAMVSQSQIIGRPFKRWCGRQQWP